MGFHHEAERDIPVARDADAIVVGAGPAGLAAAIAAARNGAKTVLIERFGFLGGVATAGLMANLNGFRNQVEPDATQTVRGIAEEIVLKLGKLGGLGKSPYPQKEYPTEPGKMSYSYAIDTEKFKYVTLKMCVDSGVDVLFHTWFSAPIMKGPRIGGVIVENKSGRLALKASVIVDASGDGDVAARAGAPYRHTRDSKEPKLGDGLMYRIQFGKKRPKDLHGMDFGSDIVVWGPGSEASDGTDADRISRAEIDARLAAPEHFARQQAAHPELADARLSETPVMFGIRQTRFIEGEYTLTGEDAIEGRRFQDVIAISSCPIIHYYGYRRYLTHEGYDIPYRCLVPKKIEGLLVAGRSISSDQRAYESHRAMIPMMAVGEAAGTAAALCARAGTLPRAIDVRALQSALISRGAFLHLNPSGA